MGIQAGRKLSNKYFVKIKDTKGYIYWPKEIRKQERQGKTNIMDTKEDEERKEEGEKSDEEEESAFDDAYFEQFAKNYLDQ